MFRITHPSSGARLSVVASLLFVLSGLFAVVAAPAQAATDTTAPVLVGFSLTPSVDTSAATQTLTATASITDDVSGLGSYGSSFTFSSPSRSRSVTFNFDSSKRTGGTVQNGVYTATLSLPRWSEQGQWDFSYGYLTDASSHGRSYSPSDFTAGGFASSFTQVGAGDSVPPALMAFDITPDPVDTSVAARTVTVTARITDDVSGLAAGNGGSCCPSYTSYVTITSPSGRTHQVYIDASKRLSGGNAQDGTYQTTLVLPRYSEQGTWRVTSGSLYDAAGNSKPLSPPDLFDAGFDIGFEQLGVGDATPPTLVGFTVSPSAINTSAAMQSITVSAHITDDVSGLAIAPAGGCCTTTSVTFRPPGSSGTTSGGRSIYVSFDAANRISGDARNGWYESTVTVPRYSDQGIWRPTSGSLYDAAGNYRTLSESDFDQPGFASTFDQQGVGDSTAPVIASFSLSPPSINTSAAAQVVTVTARITDAVSGFSPYGTSVSFVSPSGTKQVQASLDASKRISGDAQDGVYQTTITIPRFSEQGTWRIGATYSGGYSVSVNDVAGNYRSIPVSELAAGGFDTTFTQNGAGDITAPVLSEFSFTPTINTSAAARTVMVTARITDDFSGVDNPAGCCSYNGSWVRYTSPSGNRSYTVNFDSSNRTSGTAVNGLYEASLALPRYSEQGTWRIASAGFSDAAGNQRLMSASDFSTAGFQTTFEQTAVGDSTPPVLAGLTIPSGTVDTATSPQTVTLRARITDDLSGLSPYAPIFSFASPALGQSTSTPVDGVRLVSGGAQDGIYDVDVVVPRFGEVGTWVLNSVYLSDALGNTQALTRVAVSGAGFPTTFTVASAPPRTAPGAPSGVTASGGNGSVALQWTAPTADGGAAITGYTVRTYAPPGTGVIQTTTVTAPATSTTIAGLANGSTYRFTVAAINAVGTGPAATSNDVIPRAPTFSPGPIEDIPVVTTPVVSVPSVPKSGYWMVGAGGNVYAFGDARSHGNAPTSTAVDLEPTSSGNGYWIVDDLGRVFAFGDAVARGNVDGTKLTAGEKVTSLSATDSGNGYWIFTSRGRVLTFGDAPFLGDVSGLTLAGPVLDSIPTPTGAGYYMVASDGGIFAFGDAKFYGSMGGQHLNAPVQSLVPDSDGVGYWLVASDGGIFAFNADFRGSMGSSKLNRPVTGMVRSGTGYLMVGEDGGIFDFSGGPDGFQGSLGANPPANPIVSVAVLEG